jgi:aspartate racemase
MKREAETEVLGIVGGLGPLASAEFLKTLYEYGIGENEQDAPVVLMYSDPTFPDRTDSFLAGESEVLLARLIGALQCLSDAGASHFVICCMTIHYLLPRLPANLGARVVSLLDVIFGNLERRPRRHLLICSNGTRRLELFQKHRLWEKHESQIVLPDDDDQDKIHRDLIYPIKKHPDFSRLKLLLDTLLERYEVDSFIAGCSEIHVLAKHVLNGDRARDYTCLDPLAIIAREWHTPLKRSY